MRQNSGASLVVLVVAAAIAAAPLGTGPARAQQADDETLPSVGVWRAVGHDLWHAWTPAHLNAVHFPRGQAECEEAGGGCLGFAVGAEGTILTTPDSGDTWRVRRFAVPDLHDVHFVDVTTGFTVGDEGTILRTTDGGETWVRVPSGVDQDLRGVHFVDAEVGYAVGDAAGVGVVVKTTNGGDGWDAAEGIPGSDPRVRGVHFVDAKSGFVVGSVQGVGNPPPRNPRVWCTEDGGSNWSTVQPSAGGGRGHMLSVAGATEHRAYAVGDNGRMFRGAAGCAAWVDVALATAPSQADNQLNNRGIWFDWRGVSFLDSTTGFVVGDVRLASDATSAGGIARHPVILRTESGLDLPSRARLEPVHLAPMAGDSPALRDVDAPSERVAVAVGASGTIVKRVGDAAALVGADPVACLPAAIAEALGEGVVPDELVCHGPPPPDVESVEDVGSPLPPPTIDQTTRECVAASDEEDEGFACLAEFTFVFETGESSPPGSGGAPVVVGLDAGLRRLVAYSPRGPDKARGPRVVLYDVDRLEQRGIKGLGTRLRAASAHAERTGVVNLRHSDDFADVSEFDVPGMHRVALDAQRHRLFLGNPGSGTSPPRIGMVSLVGEFEPTLVTMDALLPDVPPRSLAGTGLASLAVDPSSDLLYVVTDSPGRSAVSPLLWNAGARGLQNQQVTLHAFRPRVTQDGRLALERRWHLPLEDRCQGAESSLDHFRFLGVSHDGRTVALPCIEVSFTLFGAAPVVSATILNVILPEGVDPADAGDHIADFGYLSVPMPGATGNPRLAVVRGASGAELLHWRAGARSFFWHYGLRQFVGGATIEEADGHDRHAFLVAEDPASGRLYLSGGDISGGEDGQDGMLALVQTVNLPVSVTHEHVPTGVTRLGSTSASPELGPTGVVDPATRRLFLPADTESGRRMVVLEDTVPPTRSQALTHPDAFTNDVDETVAATVSRRGETAAYGARVWWSGLNGSLPGTSQARPDGAPETFGDDTGGYTYPSLFDEHTVTGPFLSQLPWRPSGFHRELISAHVPTGVLDGEFDPRLSSATARSLTVDGESRDDLTSRRGSAQLLDGAEAQGRAGCGEWRLGNLTPPPQFRESCQEEWEAGWERFRDESGAEREEFERCSLEAHDRLLRELDGRRAVREFDDEGEPKHEAECFRDFDEHVDPHFDEDTKEPSRPSIEQRVGWTRDSRCAEPGDDSDRASEGSRTVCDLAGWRTEASSGGGLVVDLPGVGGEPGSVRVGTSVSATRSYLDPDLGMVSEALAIAGDVEVFIPDRGSFSLGEVRTVARSWAKGRPGTAGSELQVTYKDVVVAQASGVQVLACTGHGTSSPAGDDGPAVCDPDEVTDAVARVFGQSLQVRAPARDLERATTGSEGGAQGIVRRNRADFWEDVVLFDLTRDEVPGLQMTVVSDGLRFNRYKVDLAAVFTESSYQIGEPRVEIQPEPGSLTVELSDHEGVPLSGGRFLIAGGALGRECRTAPDGVGNCRFAVEPGLYEVRQLAPPTGYVATSSPATVQVAPGSDAVVSFVNVRNAGAVEVTLVDPADAPLEGGHFELTHQDGALAMCTTGPGGRCTWSPTPLGSYRLVQTGAPDGFEPADPIEFALSRPGHAASIRVVNGRTGSAAGGSSVRIVQLVDGAQPTASISGGTDTAAPFGRWRDALFDAMKFLLRSPLQALMFALVVGLFGAPAYLYWRSRRYEHALGQLGVMP